MALSPLFSRLLATGTGRFRDFDLCGARFPDGIIVTGADPVYRLEKL
jgi:hypothetical protein